MTCAQEETSKGLQRALSTWHLRRGQNHVFSTFKSSLNPNIDMEYGAKFSVFELKKEHLLLSKYNSPGNKSTMLFFKSIVNDTSHKVSKEKYLVSPGYSFCLNVFKRYKTIFTNL